MAALFLFLAQTVFANAFLEFRLVAAGRAWMGSKLYENNTVYARLLYFQIRETYHD